MEENPLATAEQGSRTFPRVSVSCPGNDAWIRSQKPDWLYSGSFCNASKYWWYPIESRDEDSDDVEEGSNVEEEDCEEGGEEEFSDEEDDGE